jgi:tetratricopeptide (TPR) repeat protein
LAEHAIALLDRDEDMRSMSRLHSQLGMFLLRTQPPEVDAARGHLEAARRELDWSQATPVEKANNDVALARAHLLAGEYDEARALLTTTLAAADHSAPLLAADCLTLLGQIDLNVGDVGDAREHYQRAILLLTGVSADRTVAQRWLELGSLLDQAGLTEEARDAYRRAAVSTGLTDPTVSLPRRVEGDRGVLSRQRT